MVICDKCNICNDQACSHLTPHQFNSCCEIASCYVAEKDLKVLATCTSIAYVKKQRKEKIQKINDNL